MKEYPVWLVEQLLRQEFRWDKALKTDFSRFLAKYNLHDSYWFGLWINPGRETIAIIQWDIIHPFWLYPDLFPGDVWNTNKWPFLLLNFRPPPHQIHSSGNNLDYYRSIITHASSRTVSAHDREQMLNLAIAQTHVEDRMKDFYLNEDLRQTVIEILGGKIYLFHDAMVEILCMNWEGEILEIPGI